MRAITFHAPERLAHERVADATLGSPGDAVVRMTSAGICGSDLHPYFGREIGLDPGTIMGHELVGEVVEVGADVRGFAPGDRVVMPFSSSCGECPTCRTGLTARCQRGHLFGWVSGGVGLEGAQAELVRVPLADGTLVPLPDDLDEAVALLAGDVLGTAMYGVELAAVVPGDLVVVVGCGPVGLLAVRAALAAGAREVVAVDRVAGRLALAERWGATPARDGAGGGGATAPDGARGTARGGAAASEALALVRERSGGRGADAAIEAVGTPEATRTAADLLRPGGALAAVGVHVEPHLALSPGELYDRNLRYAAGRCPARRLLPAALALARAEERLLSELISHRLPLSEGVEAYRRFGAREEGWTKVVLRPEG